MDGMTGRQKDERYAEQREAAADQMPFTHGDLRKQWSAPAVTGRGSKAALPRCPVPLQTVRGGFGALLLRIMAGLGRWGPSWNMYGRWPAHANPGLAHGFLSTEVNELILFPDKKPLFPHN